VTFLPGRVSIWIIYQWQNWFPDGTPLIVRGLIGLLAIFSRFWRFYLPRRAPCQLRRLLKGKRVCVTGPSKSVLLNPAGYIESFDIVVRLNHVWPVKKSYQGAMGSRCDVLYHVCNASGDLVAIINSEQFNTIKYMRLMPHVNEATLRNCWWRIWSSRLATIRTRPANDYRSLAEACEVHSVPWGDFHHGRTMPYLNRQNEQAAGVINTGFYAICDLLDCDITELYITGITFNLENDFEGYGFQQSSIRIREGKESHHNADDLFEIFKRILKRDKRIRVDEVLSRIIRSNDIDSSDEIDQYCEKKK
jgi:hypothetical protein